MPLDLKKFRQDPAGFEASLRQSLALRRQPQVPSTKVKGNNNNDKEPQSTKESNDTVIDDVLCLHQESSTTLLKLHQCRAKRNEQKKRQQAQAKHKKKATSSDSEPPPAEVEDDSSISSSFPTKKDEEALEACHRKASLALERALLELPNYVDETILNEYSCNENVATATEPPVIAQQNLDDTNKTKKKAAIHISPEDAFYCLGGYEDLVGLTAMLENNAQSVVLTDLGMQLLTALEKILIETLCLKSRDQQSATFAQWTLPETLPLPPQTVYSIWGRVVGDKKDDENSDGSGSAMLVQAPSWMGFVRHYLSGKTYYDRELPMYHFISSSPTSTTITPIPPSPPSSSTNRRTGSAAATAMNDTLQDAREVHRRATWTAASPSKSTNGKKSSSRSSHAQHVPWYNRLVAGSKRVEVMVLTGPSLQADSRIVQKETMQRLVDFYASLLPPTADADSVLQVRAVPPSQLLPVESSRLVLQGHWPSTNTLDMKKKAARDPVCLAYLSNLQDYASCFIDASASTKTAMTAQQQQQNLLSLRHGNSRFGERVHVLHGTICSLTETLEWMMQHNAAVCAASNDDSSIDLPARVAAFMQVYSTSSSSSSPPTTGTTIEKNNATSMLRRRRRRLAYKRTVSTNKHGKRIVAPVPVPKPPRVDLSKLSKVEKAVTDDCNSNDSGRRNGLCILEIGQKLAPDEIRREALSCPFEFLPFYHQK